MIYCEYTKVASYVPLMNAYQIILPHCNRYPNRNFTEWFQERNGSFCLSIDLFYSQFLPFIGPQHGVEEMLMCASYLLNLCIVYFDASCLLSPLSIS